MQTTLSSRRRTISVAVEIIRYSCSCIPSYRFYLCNDRAKLRLLSDIIIIFWQYLAAGCSFFVKHPQNSCYKCYKILCEESGRILPMQPPFIQKFMGNGTGVLHSCGFHPCSSSVFRILFSSFLFIYTMNSFCKQLHCCILLKWHRIVITKNIIKAIRHNMWRLWPMMFCFPNCNTTDDKRTFTFHHILISTHCITHSDDIIK